MMEDIIPKNSLMLDAGCGDGSFSSSLAQTIVGIDFDSEEIRILRGLGILGDLTSMPIRDDVFSFLISNSVMEHIQNVRKAMNECARISRTDALMIVTVPTGDGMYDFILRILFRLNHLLDADGWCTIIEDSGFKVKNVTKYLPIIVRRLYVLTCIFPPLVIFNQLFVNLLSRVKGGSAGICIVSRRG